MSREYAMSRVRDALEKSEGNHLKTQRLLMSWVEKDQSLLLGLVTPHIQSIVSHAINFVDQQPKALAATDVAATLNDGEAGEFGAAVLESLQGGRNEGGFGFGEPAPRGVVSRPGKASQSHVDAIHKIAGKKTDKKD
ncbi:MAG TPA: hypothetical protein VHP34_08620 [Alphaproteobacteria bacterium]|nr:hypothetical protein [Alphaproteobacteria bacterium]